MPGVLLLLTTKVPFERSYGSVNEKAKHVRLLGSWVVGESCAGLNMQLPKMLQGPELQMRAVTANAFHTVTPNLSELCELG